MLFAFTYLWSYCINNSCFLLIFGYMLSGYYLFSYSIFVSGKAVPFCPDFEFNSFYSTKNLIVIFAGGLTAFVIGFIRNESSWWHRRASEAIYWRLFLSVRKCLNQAVILAAQQITVFYRCISLLRKPKGKGRRGVVWGEAVIPPP